MWNVKALTILAVTRALGLVVVNMAKIISSGNISIEELQKTTLFRTRLIAQKGLSVIRKPPLPLDVPRISGQG